MRYISPILALCALCNLSQSLKIGADTVTIEHTPSILAIRDFYNGSTPATIVEGGVPGLLRDRTIDVATNAETQSLRNYVNNKDLRIIFTVTEVYYRIVANKNANITKLEDLRGKRIGSIASTSAAYFVQKFLSMVGIKENEYTLVSVMPCNKEPCPASTLPVQLDHGSIDAIALWEVSPQLGIDRLGENATVFYQPDNSIYREQVSLHSTVSKLADPAIRADIVEFVRALIKAQKVYREDPESVIPLVAEAIDMDEDVLKKAWDVHFWKGTLAADLLEVLKVEDKWLARTERRRELTDEELEGLIDSSVYEEALRG